MSQERIIEYVKLGILSMILLLLMRGCTQLQIIVYQLGG